MLVMDFWSVFDILDSFYLELSSAKKFGHIRNRVKTPQIWGKLTKCMAMNPPYR